MTPEEARTKALKALIELEALGPQDQLEDAEILNLVISIVLEAVGYDQLHHLSECQPYPTKWAYEQACKALHTAEARVDRLQTRVAELEANSVTVMPSSGVWKDGEQEPPETVHMLGDPKCVKAVQEAIAERDRLAARIAELEAKNRLQKQERDGAVEASQDLRKRIKDLEAAIREHQRMFGYVQSNRDKRLWAVLDE